MTVRMSVPAALLGLAAPLHGWTQSHNVVANAVDLVDHRIVYSSAFISRADVQRVASAFELVPDTVAGLPSAALFGRKVTVSLVVGDAHLDADAWSWPTIGSAKALRSGRLAADHVNERGCFGRTRGGAMRRGWACRVWMAWRKVATRAELPTTTWQA